MKKRASITNLELEEIVFILLNCLDEEKKKNREIINTLKVYLLYHKGQILNYVFSFLQIQKVSHENQKLLLCLVHDFVHYCIHNRFSNTVDEYLGEVKRNEGEKEERADTQKGGSQRGGPQKGDTQKGDTQKGGTHRFKDLHIFENILRYSFFDGDEHCFLFQDLPEGVFLPDAVPLQGDAAEGGALQQADSGTAFSPRGSLHFATDGNPRERSMRSMKRRGRGSIFHQDKIAKLLCLKKEEYKTAMISEREAAKKSNQCTSPHVAASAPLGGIPPQNAKETSEINNIIRNIIDFLLNEILFIKRDDERHGIMTKLLILCVVREDAYLKKKLVEKLNGCLRVGGAALPVGDSPEGGGKPTIEKGGSEKVRSEKGCSEKVSGEKVGNDKVSSENVRGDNPKLRAYLELYIDLLTQVPHLTKSVLNEFFSAVLSLGQSTTHADLTHKVMTQIFQDIQFPSVLYTIIRMNTKYKRKNFIIPNKHHTNVFIENDIIHLSLENTSEDTCTTYTRESSLNSNVLGRSNTPGKSNTPGIFNNSGRQANLRRPTEGERNGKGTSYKDPSSEHTSRDASPCEVFYDAHNGEVEPDGWDTPPGGECSQGRGSDGGAQSNWGPSKGKNNLVKAFQREAKPSEHAAEPFRNESEGSEKYYTVKNWREGAVCQVPEGSGGSPKEKGDLPRGKGILSPVASPHAAAQLPLEKERRKAEETTAVCSKMLALYLSMLPTLKRSSENYRKLLYIISKLVLYVNNDELTKKVIEECIHYFLVFFHATVNNASVSEISGGYNKDLQVHINYSSVRGLPQYSVINSFRSILQKCLTKIHLIVGFASHTLKVAYAILLTMINQNYTMSNAKGIANYITSNVYVSTFVEVMELFNIFITCAYTSNLVLSFIREKVKSSVKVEVIVSLTLLRQYLLLISGDIGSGNNMVHLSNQNMKTKGGPYKKCFKRLSSFITDANRTNTSNVELVIQMVANLSDRFCNDLSIIYMLLEINLLLSYHQHFDSSSFNPNVILGLLPRVSSPLCDLYMGGEAEQSGKGEQSGKSRKSGKGKQSGKSGKGEALPPSGEPPLEGHHPGERINPMGHHGQEIKTWLLIPSKHVIKIMHFLINTLLSEESKFKKQNKKYGYEVDDSGTIIDANNNANEVLQNGFHHNRMFFDVHWNYFIFMDPSVPYVKKLIALAFEKHLCFYSPRVLYPLLFELLVDVKRSFKIVATILKALNIMCILLHNHMVKKHLRLHSRLHYNYLVLPNISNVISVLFMYCTHSDIVVSFLSLQLISILRSFTQGKSIASVQSFTYFELLLSLVRLSSQAVARKGDRAAAPLAGGSLYSRRILKRIIALSGGGKKKPQKHTAAVKRARYYRSLVKGCYREIARGISKRVLDVSLNVSRGACRKGWRRKVRAIARHYFSVDLGGASNERHASEKHANETPLGAIPPMVSTPCSLDVGTLVGANPPGEGEASTCHAATESLSSRFTRILHLMQTFFSSYVKVEIGRIYNYHSYVTTFFYSLVELVRLLKSSQEFESTLLYLSVINLLCVIIKQFSGKYANKMITIFFKLNEEVPVNEEENLFLTLYMNFSTIYRSHFFILYKEKCTTPYMRNCIECIQLMRADCLSFKKSTENQLDFNNFMLLSNKYSTDMSREKNVSRFVHYLNEYQAVYRARLLQLGICSEGGGGPHHKGEKKHMDVKRIPPTGENFHDGAMQNKVVHETTLQVNHQDDLKKRLYQSNEVVRKSYQLLEDKLGSYILQNDISFSISKQFHQDVTSHYIESILHKNNLFRVLFLLNSIYHSDVANRKSSAFSIFGKSTNVINAENIRSTLILTMGKCLRKVPSSKVRDLHVIRDVYMNEKLFAIYVKHVYVPLARYSTSLGNAIHGRDDSPLTEEHIVREVLSNRQRYVDERYKEEIKMNALVRRDILSGVEKRDSGESSQCGPPPMSAKVNVNASVSASVNSASLANAANPANLWKRLPSEKINLLVFQLLVDPIICSLYEEKEATLQASLLRALKMVSKKLKCIRAPGGEAAHRHRMKWDHYANRVRGNLEATTTPQPYVVTNTLDRPTRWCSTQDVCDHYMKENVKDVPFYSCLCIYKYIVIHSALYYVANFDEQPLPISSMTFTGVGLYALYFKQERRIITSKSEHQLREDLKASGSNGSNGSNESKKKNQFEELHLQKEQHIIGKIDMWGRMIEWEYRTIDAPSERVIYNDYFSDLVKERGSKNDSTQGGASPGHSPPSEPHLDIPSDTYANLKNALKSIHYCLFVEEPMQFHSALIIVDVLTRLLLKIVLNERKQMYCKWHDSADVVGQGPNMAGQNADESVTNEGVAAKNGASNLDTAHVRSDQPEEKQKNKSANISKGKRTIPKGNVTKEKKLPQGVNHTNGKMRNNELTGGTPNGEEQTEHHGGATSSHVAHQRGGDGRAKWDGRRKSQRGADEDTGSKGILPDEHFPGVAEQKKKKKSSKRIERGHTEGHTDDPLRANRRENKLLHSNSKPFRYLRKYEGAALSCLNLISSIIVKAALRMDSFPLQFKIIKYLHDTCVATNIAEVKFVSFRILSQIVISAARVGTPNGGCRMGPLDGAPPAEDTQTGHLKVCRLSEKKHHHGGEIDGDRSKGKRHEDEATHGGGRANRNDHEGKNLSSCNSSNFEKYFNLIFSPGGNISYGNFFDANDEHGGMPNRNEGSHESGGGDSGRCSSHRGGPDGQNDSSEHYLDSVSNAEGNVIKETAIEGAGGNHLHRGETTLRGESGGAGKLNGHMGSDKGSNSSIMYDPSDSDSPPGGAADHVPHMDEGGSLQEQSSGEKNEAKNEAKSDVKSEAKGERNYLCECIGLLIPYVKDPERVISYLSVCSVCALLGKLQRGRMLSNWHFVHFFFNRIEVILDGLSSPVTNRVRGRRAKRKAERERATWKGKLDGQIGNTWKGKFDGQTGNTLEEDPPNQPNSGAANCDEHPTEETFRDEGEGINEKTCCSDGGGSDGGGSVREDEVGEIAYDEAKVTKEGLNGLPRCERGHRREPRHRRLAPPRISYQNVRSNMRTVERHNHFLVKVGTRIREINSGTYQTRFIKRLGQLTNNTRKETNVYKAMSDAISEVLSNEEKMSYVNCLISCIHNKNRQVAISGLNLLMYHTWAEQMSHQDIDVIMSRVLNEVHYYTKVNVLSGSGESPPSGSFSKAAPPRGTDEPNSTLEAYRIMCRARQDIEGPPKGISINRCDIRSDNRRDNQRDNPRDNLRDKPVRGPNVLERALRTILVLCRKHPYVVVNKLCTLQSKYSYEHVYFIFMICNNERLLHKTMDYLFYLMNSLDTLKLTKNLSNILSLVFHFLKFRNGYIRDYTRRYFVELFVIMFFVLGVKQLGHMSGVLAGAAKGRAVVAEKVFPPSGLLGGQHYAEGGEQVKEQAKCEAKSQRGEADKTEEAIGVGSPELPEQAHEVDQKEDPIARVAEKFQERRGLPGRSNTKGAPTQSSSYTKGSPTQSRNNAEGNSRDGAPLHTDSDDNFAKVVNGSPFFLRRNSILRSRDVKKVSRGEFSKKIYQNYTCSISVNNTLNCVRIIKELLKLNGRKRILRRIEEGRVEKLLYYKHSFENGLIELVRIVLSSLGGSATRGSGSRGSGARGSTIRECLPRGSGTREIFTRGSAPRCERGHCRKVFGFLEIFLKSRNINYVIISLVTLSQLLLCMRIEPENVRLVEPIIKVLYQVNCTHKNDVVTKYLHLCFTNLFIIFKAIREYQLETGSEPVPVLIKEEYTINVLNSLFVYLDSSDRNIVKVTLKAFKEACKYAREQWPSPLCASYVNMLTTPSVVLPYLNSSEAAEKILMCGILREVFRTLRWERQHKGGLAPPTQTDTLPKKHLYEIATYLMIHLVDKRKNVSANVWKALKEFLRWKFSHHVNSTLLFFDRKLFLPSGVEVGRYEVVRSQVCRSSVGMSQVDRARRITIQREYFKGAGAEEGEQVATEGADYDYFAKGLAWDEKSGSVGEINGGMVSCVPADTPTGGHTNGVEKAHQQKVAPHGRNTTGETRKKGKKKKRNRNRRHSTNSAANKSDEESDVSQAYSSPEVKKERINTHYYKLLVEICIPLIICIDTKVSLKRDLFAELNGYLYGADVDPNEEDRDSLLSVKKESDRLQQIFFTNLQMNLSSINSVYRAFIILLSSRSYLGPNVWNANIPINQDIERMISEYEVKSTKSRAEHVLFGDLSNYVHAWKRRERTDGGGRADIGGRTNRGEEKQNKRKKQREATGEDAMQKSITSVWTDSILSTLSGTFNYSYDGAFFNSLSVSGSVEKEYTHRGKDSTEGDAIRTPHNCSRAGWSHQAIRMINTSGSAPPNGDTSSEAENADVCKGEEPKEGPPPQGRAISTHNLPSREGKKDHAAIGPSGEPPSDEPPSDDGQGEEVNKVAPLEEGQGTPLQREFPSLEYKRSRSFDPGERLSDENYANFVSSSDEGEAAGKEASVKDAYVRDAPVGDSLLKDVTPPAELLNYTPGDRSASQFVRRKFAKIQLLNQKYSCVDKFKTALNLKMETSLLQWIEMLKFLKEDPPEFILPRETKAAHHLADFFESALICTLSVVKFVSLSLDCKKLHRVTLKRMRREAQALEVAPTVNAKLSAKVGGAGGGEEEPHSHLQHRMEETYFIQLLSICMKLEALCSSISKQLCAFLQEQHAPDRTPDRAAEHLPIIRALAALSILKPSP
ncbi:conserved Plasmodium protein, unknown function [Plasmodium vivax]|uniref:Uncharacterized protein n=1 Tax=Plasmodium vivax TaxID=5855 RepID=A0A1G4HBV1_PLAVI|nr:conserved Plasmodium protein, unknown function [Plasmodium vivax]